MLNLNLPKLAVLSILFYFIFFASGFLVLPSNIKEHKLVDIFVPRPQALIITLTPRTPTGKPHKYTRNGAFL